MYFAERAFSKTRILSFFLEKCAISVKATKKTGKPANEYRKVRVRRGAPHPTPATGAAGIAEGAGVEKGLKGA